MLPVVVVVGGLVVEVGAEEAEPPAVVAGLGFPSLVVRNWSNHACCSCVNRGGLTVEDGAVVVVVVVGGSAIGLLQTVGMFDPLGIAAD